DTPHIFSRGFQFKFDVRHELGYIVPEWVPDPIVPEVMDSTITQIFLPLKSNSDFNQNELFEGIDLVPLFLHKLKELRITSCDKDGLATRSKSIRVYKQENNIRQIVVTTNQSEVITLDYM